MPQTLDLTLPGVRRFTDGLSAQLDRCDNGEGNACATLDASLRHYAGLCCEFREGVRAWARAVFAGEVALDAEVEVVLRTEGRKLYARAAELAAYGRVAELPCYALDGQTALERAVWDLYRLLAYWVTPTRAVGPAARHRPDLGPDAVARIQGRLAALPPLPAGWQPADPRQLARLRKLPPR